MVHTRDLRHEPWRYRLRAFVSKPANLLLVTRSRQEPALAAALPGRILATLEGLPGSAPDLPGRVTALADALDGVATSLSLPGIPAAMRARLAGIVDALSPLLDTASDVARLMDDVAAGRITARLEWRPDITPWGLPGVPRIFDPLDPRGLRIDVVVQASAAAAPSVDISAAFCESRTQGNARMKKNAAGRFTSSPWEDRTPRERGLSSG